MVNPFNSDRNIVCDHSLHLFSNPLCKEQPLIKRIANVTFHLLTLGIPLAVYKLMSICCPSFIGLERQGSRASLDLSYVQKGIKPLSSLEKDAIARAKLILETTDKSILSQFQLIDEDDGVQSRHPVNNEINDYIRLTKMYNQKLMDLIKAKAGASSDIVWKDTEILKCADDLISIHVASCHLMFEDLEGYLAKYPNLKSKERALTDQSGYMSLMFFRFVEEYDHIRGGLRYEDGAIIVGIDVNPELSKAFYKKDTLQNKWRLLRNNFCERMRQHTANKELMAVYDVGDRYPNNTIPDNSYKTYRVRVVNRLVTD